MLQNDDRVFILAGSLKSECSITDMAPYCRKFIMAGHAIISMT